MPDVQVTNGNRFQLKGRYGGKDYVFPPGKPVTIPEKAAEHIFALSEERENKTGALNRLGLLCRPGDTLERAYDALDRVTLREGHTVFESPKPMPPPSEEEEEEDEESDDLPDDEPAEEEIGDSPGAPRNPGGESEAGFPSAADALAPVEFVEEPPADDMDSLAREVLSKRRKRANDGG